MWPCSLYISIKLPQPIPTLGVLIWNWLLLPTSPVQNEATGYTVGYKVFLLEINEIHWLEKLVWNATVWKKMQYKKSLITHCGMNSAYSCGQAISILLNFCKVKRSTIQYASSRTPIICSILWVKRQQNQTSFKSLRAHL